MSTGRENGVDGARVGGARGLSHWFGVGLVVAGCAVSLGPAVFQPFFGDDVYVLESLRSDAWGSRLSAFDFDAPSADDVSWWSGAAYQRRFVRVPSSALLWVQWKLFGLRPEAFHAVTWLCVLAAALLVFRRARRSLTPLSAALVALVPAVHPASAEVVGTMNCQPLALAGLCAVLAALAWERGWETGSIRWRALAWTAVAITSYEAAIVLPFLLIFVEAWLRGRLNRKSAAAMVALFVAYVPAAIAVRRGLTVPDTGPMRPAAEVWRSARLDGEAYLLKTFGLFDPDVPQLYWVHRHGGELLAIALAFILLGGVWFCFADRRLGLSGMAVFGGFLLAPWVTRATVAQLNLPTLRQLALPVMLGGPLLLAAVLERAGTLRLIASGALLALLAVQAIISGGVGELVRERREIDAGLRRVLQGVPDGQEVITVDDGCGSSPSLVHSGPALSAIPPSRGDDAPVLRALDDHAVLAESSSGFAILDQVRPPKRATPLDRGPGWFTRRPPLLLSNGWQRTPGATVAIAEQHDGLIHALRLRFDRPLREITMLRWASCTEVERLSLQP
jgi:hypothetical protein